MRSVMEGWKETEKVFETELEDALRLLKLNRENVPEEELQTRYRKKYARLKADIGRLAEEYVKIHITYGILFEEKDRKAVTDAVNQAILKSGIASRVRDAAFLRQDMEEIRKLAEGLKKLVWKQTKAWRIADCPEQAS